jgi:hypothetical protein
MAHVLNEFRNVVLCDDVRDEIGNKKSLMGVFSGDIIVQELPATIPIAIYLEFVPVDPTKSFELSIKLSVDSDEIAKANIPVVLNPGSSNASIILPKGLVRFDKESTFKVTAKIDDELEVELVSKKIIKRNL